MQTDDPHDEWQVFMRSGELCKLVQYDSGVSPMADDPYNVSWKYEVVDTDFMEMISVKRPELITIE